MSDFQHTPLAERYMSIGNPSKDQIRKVRTLQNSVQNLAVFLNDLLPNCVEKSRAFDALDEVLFNAQAAIHRHGDKPQSNIRV